MLCAWASVGNVSSVLSLLLVTTYDCCTYLRLETSSPRETFLSEGCPNAVRLACILSVCGKYFVGLLPSSTRHRMSASAYIPCTLLCCTCVRIFWSPRGLLLFSECCPNAVKLHVPLGICRKWIAGIPHASPEIFSSHNLTLIDYMYFYLGHLSIVADRHGDDVCVSTDWSLCSPVVARSVLYALSQDLTSADDSPLLISTRVL
jgi:hypothetical protein